MLSVQDAVNENLIEPIFIGHEVEIQKCAEDIKWDISKYELIHVPVENDTAKIAAKLASDGKVQIIVKGHIHTDVLMKEVIKKEYNLLGKTRLSHIWHMTLEKNDQPIIITDGALNVSPNVKTKIGMRINSATELIFISQKCAVPDFALPIPSARFLSVTNFISYASNFTRSKQLIASKNRIHTRRPSLICKPFQDQALVRCPRSNAAPRQACDTIAPRLSLT